MTAHLFLLSVGRRLEAVGQHAHLRDGLQGERETTQNALMPTVTSQGQLPSTTSRICGRERARAARALLAVVALSVSELDHPFSFFFCTCECVFYYEFMNESNGMRVSLTDFCFTLLQECLV